MNFELTPEEEMFRRTAREWTDKECPKAWANEAESNEENYPYELWDKLAEAGFFGIGIDEQYGGQGGDVFVQAILGRELSRNLAGLSWVWGITSFVGTKAVAGLGNERQKQALLPQVAEGKLRFSIGFTEPGGGTDLLGALRTEARQDGDDWIISGQKTWCTQAHVADYILLLARTGPPEPKRHDGLSVFLVPGDSKGLSTSLIPKLGQRSMGSCDVSLDEVRVPGELLLGEPGKAWYKVLPALNNERIVMAAFCCGILDGVLEDAVAYVGDREAFGHKIGEFQSLQHFIADIALWRKQAWLVTAEAAWRQQQGHPCGNESNMAKLIASEYATAAADLGIQILGGMGYASEMDMQRYWRDARLFRLSPITNEMARNSIAQELGLPRSF